MEWRVPSIQGSHFCSPQVLLAEPAGQACGKKTCGLLETTCFIHFVVLLIVFAGLYSLFLLNFAFI